MGAQHFPFYIILSNPFCSIKIKITTFDRLGFMFVQRCVVLKYVSVKERDFSGKRIICNFPECSTYFV